MGWFYLVLAGMCEMVWPIGFKYTNGFKEHGWATIGTFGVMGLSFWLMGIAIRHGIHVGNAYAVWTGIGATGTAALGIVLFNEPRHLPRLLCLALIIVGVIGVKLTSNESAAEAAQGNAAADESAAAR